MHPILRLFYLVLFIAVAAMLVLFLLSNYRQWRRSRNFAKAIEQPKFDYMARELGTRCPQRDRVQ